MIHIISKGATGLGLFLLGMRFMTTTLKVLVSTEVKNRMKTLKINPFMGVGLGILATILMQSSSGSTVIMVGLVEAGILSIYQITPMIMGANIGTTITAQIIAFKAGPLSPILLILGLIISFMSPHRKLKLLGDMLLGLALIFIGLELLQEGLAPLQEIQPLKRILSELGVNPILGVLMGFSTAAIIQSSSTGIAILQSMAMNNSISISSAIPILLGQNIGTCVTTLLASIHLSNNGKRAAFIHFIFNVLGVIVMFPFINVLCETAIAIAENNPARQLAHAHTIFNLSTTALLLPLFPLMIRISKFFIKK